MKTPGYRPSTTAKTNGTPKVPPRQDPRRPCLGAEPVQPAASCEPHPQHQTPAGGRHFTLGV